MRVIDCPCGHRLEAAECPAPSILKSALGRAPAGGDFAGTRSPRRAAAFKRAASKRRRHSGECSPASRWIKADRLQACALAGARAVFLSAATLRW
jgi:hypothetical protein